jgi:hypothetical protein
VNIHVCLVSAQAAANLLPALDPALKPQRAVLVVSSKMEQRAEHLRTVLKGNGIEVVKLDLIDEHDYAQTETALQELAETLKQEEVFLNITGGTKLMSLAAQTVAAAYGWTMFYVDADTDTVSWLGKDAPPPHLLKQQLRLPHYLQSYGFALGARPERPQPSKAHQQLIETLLMQIGSLESSLATLNWLAQGAEEKRSLVARLDEHQKDSRSLELLLRHFSEAGVLAVEGSLIRFTDDASLTFVKGGWLELHVMNIVHRISGELGIRDKAANLEVIDAGGTKNELDVAFMAHNRLFVIECKTARMDKPEAPKANETLFKLVENCRRIGGIGTRGMLVSYRGLRDSEKRLARALGIEVVCGQDIQQLSARISTWARPG